ncbi:MULTISPECIES: NAD(P)-dependent oxidoreductase [unclassified Streptomyces]|uniref:NAD(P)-dependent oxidoreductase n=1 Tax=unclassified Streptomyces TaxID=2593676 RepID=UPI00081E4FA4|nr:NAD(P)-dependent oxidoreductase [Streptomyces sp. ScaeMP-e83]MYR93491.1 oxidoreductase [Streptomyces sp. SID4937]SCD53681.1 D-3-phosphoglycerate dehydrogenase [Streptomyces sp. ScaeMP-e83]
MERSRVLLVDAAPGALLGRELERLLGHGLDVTLNLRRVADPAGARADWGGRVAFTDFDPFDEAALLAETVRDGLGHHAVKSRAGVPLRAAFLAGATRAGLAHPLRVIGRAGAGTDHVDLAAAARNGVVVTHTPGSDAAAVAEFALAQLLTLTRSLRSYDEAAHRGEWRAPTAPPAELSELTLGIVGPGRIGLALAGRARALGMVVQAYGRRRDAGSAPRPASTATRAPRPVPTLPDLLATSDVVSLHLPLTPATRGLIGRAELALMRPGAVLLNTARGGIVDEHALADALRDPAHPLAAAAVDAFEHEHAAFASPLFGLPNALLTPHVAGMTRTAMATAALRCADHIAALLSGRPEGVPVVTA